MAAPRSLSRAGASAVCLVMLLASCGGSSNDAATTSSGSSSATTAAATTSTTAAITTSANETTTSNAPTTVWRGEEAELFAMPGDVLAVVGVEYTDELNVRAGPGIEHPIVDRVGPTESVTATGRVWQIVGEGFWNEVTTNGETGWANLRYLAYAGGVDDATSEIIAEIGQIPEAETMLELGLIAAQPFVTDEPPTRVVLAVAPSVGDLGEVTYDLIGFGDDSVLGVRLHVFGQPLPSSEGFSLGSVERTALCARGLSGELCV